VTLACLTWLPRQCFRLQENLPGWATGACDASRRPFGLYDLLHRLSQGLGFLGRTGFSL